MMSVAWFFCMARRLQLLFLSNPYSDKTLELTDLVLGKPPFVEHSHKSCLFASLIGLPTHLTLTPSPSDSSTPARYANSKLVEINSHSLFSRWFSESGKLVQRLFSSVTDMVDDESTFVVVLIGGYSFPVFFVPRTKCRLVTPIDEVESLTAARAGAMAGTEPSDALRVELFHHMDHRK